jgi:hypothetical protein
MRIASHDRAEVLNVAGAGHLSPAVRDGVPCLVHEGETAGRVGWETFFAALHRAGLVVAWEAEDPSSAAPVPAAEGRPLERHPGLGPALERTRRFVAAFRGGPAASPDAPG